MRRFALLAIAVGAFASFWVAPARAITPKSYISGITGNDANNCEIANPCATFQGALAQTFPNGEIDCIDSPAAGVFGLTITKSITIECSRAAAATLLHTDLPGLTINITPGDTYQTVRLRGLSINGWGTGKRGISIVAAKTVILEDMEITNESQQGIADVRTTGGLLLIKNSVIAKNAGAGIAIAATGGPYGATLDNVRSFNNGFGVAVGSGNNVMVTKSVLSGSTVAGLEMDAGAQVTLIALSSTSTPPACRAQVF